MKSSNSGFADGSACAGSIAGILAIAPPLKASDDYPSFSATRSGEVVSDFKPMTLSPEVERDWVRRASSGSLEAMEMLFNEHKGMVFAVGLSVCGNASDADEVVQESFLRAFRSLGDWRGDARFSTWIYSIAVRTALNWKTRFLRRPAPPSREEAETPPSDAERQEAIDALMAAIQELPLQQRLALTLKHLRQMSLEQIAEAQGIAVGTVKSNLHHAVAKLRDLLEEGAAL
jgi:RNA polymerase sigma-70 factor (ECF subfamily)